ncbi:MAG TPA: YceI family protein [Steroidobacteraceae bacterium]|nr:YceI family protein [Steroidobacteraceae bacterium]
MISRLTSTIALVLASAPLYAMTYTLEPGHTQGIIRWNHLGFVNPTAQFSMVEGTLDFDEAAATKSSVTVTIPLAAMSTGVPDLNDYLRSADFFDLAKYPTATFKSTMVEKNGETGRLKVTGNLNLHGITKPIILDVTINKVGTNPRNQVATVGFEATAMLNRSDFGLGLYVPQVSDEIRLHITTEAAEAKGYAGYLKAEAAKESAREAKKK